MRSINTLRVLAMAVSMAAAVSVAPTIQAQQVTPPHVIARGPGNNLFAGIKLSTAQRAQIKALRDPKGALRSQNQTERAKIRGARAEHDTAAAKGMRMQLKTQREETLTQIRGILTPDQRVRFDANLAARRGNMKADRAGRRPQ